MKNIHILPTNQKSKIFFNHNKGFEKYQFSKEPFVNGLTNTSNQNIYITNDEEIKDGDWILEISDNSIFTIQIQPNTNLSKYKKVILTTDLDLIASGVQAIDDGFLEWFVQNPSCEVIQVEKSFHWDNGVYEYEIIIPKEEPTIVRLPTYYETKQEIKLEDIFNDDKKENIKKFVDEIQNPSEPNQALKDAFEKYSEYLEDFENKNTYEHGFKDGAKWQQEQDKKLYSEEEMIAFGEFIFKHTLLAHSKGVKNLFEQFKKK